MSARAAERRVGGEDRHLHEHGDEEEQRALERVEDHGAGGRRFRDQHEHRLQRAEVGERLHLDLLEEVGVVLADARHASDQDPARVDRRQLALSGRAGGDDRVAGLDLLVLRDAVERERVARAAVLEEPDRPGWLASAALTALSGSVISITFETLGATFVTWPTRPSGVITTSWTATPSVSRRRS